MPMWGLNGAVIATLCAHAVVLTGVWIAMARSDFRFDLTLLTITVIPATLLAGPTIAIAFVVLAIVSNRQIRSWINEGVEIVVARMPRPHRRLALRARQALR